MKVQDIIRTVLDLIDRAEAEKAPEPTMTVDMVATGDEEMRRFQHIVNMLTTNDADTLSNAPNEQYADIDAVTTDAGGGVNGPKHPADIRGEHPSMYPAHQHGVR